MVSAPAAVASTQAECTVEAEDALSPGLGLNPTSGTFTGGPAPLTCTGAVDGKQITGPGTWAYTGRYGLSRPYGCGDTSGDYVQRTTVTLPTAAGPVRLVSDGSGTFGPLQGGSVLGGILSGPRLRATFGVLPTEGNCVSAPLTRARCSYHVWLLDG
jgi:hypothetical protein